jgi:hypothetical protein
MGFMRKQMLMQQKKSFEQTLQERLSFLSRKKIPSPKADKDTIVRKLKADIKAVNSRLRTVANHEKRSEELAEIKAERTAAPRKEQEAGKSEKPKKASEVSEGKKLKSEGGKSQKTAQSPGEAKAEIKKNVDGTSKVPAGTTETPAKS